MTRGLLEATVLKEGAGVVAAEEAPEAEPVADAEELWVLWM